ncbi:MAG: rubrerythrin family protein, partial [Candidatus Bathyarchaeia archaeon]
YMRYVIFSEIAEAERFPNVARLFKAISYAERIHASNHFSNLAYLEGGYLTIGMAGFGPGKTLKNLGIAIDGELFEVNEMYPTYLETARSQGEQGAARSFNYAYQTEKVHAALFQKAKDTVQNGQDVQLGPIHICASCGYTVEGEAPDVCPICNAKKDRFRAF